MWLRSNFKRTIDKTENLEVMRDFVGYKIIFVFSFQVIIHKINSGLF